jgi:hypothetical protein
VGFAVFGIMAKKQYRGLEEDCSPGCTDEELNATRGNALVADISLGVGVTAAVAAVLVTVFAGGKDEEKAVHSSPGRFSLGVEPRARGALGTFSLSFE